MFSLLRPLALNRCFAKLPNLSSKAVRFASLESQNVKIAEDSEKVSASSESILINPLDVPDYFGVHQLVSLKQLFDNRVHYGHKEGSLNEYMAPYLYGSRLGVCIMDLNQTVAHLKDALNFTAHIAFRGGVILFVSNHKETGQYVEKTAKECGEYAHCRHYQTATFTASENFFDHDGVRDCAKMFIPSIAICDSNSDPRLVTYPVPGNDDTPSAIHLYCDLFKQAILKGKAAKDEILKQIATESNQKSTFE